jgi:[ribosomal protein S5]-alanine N-acetyltransferase
VHVITDALYETERIVIRRLALSDRRNFINLVRLSEDFLRPWVDLPSTPAKFDIYIKRFDGKTAEAMLICTREYGEIVGAVSINDIVRGPYQRGILGYNAFSSSAGQGYVREGLRLIFRYAFMDLGLHRLEADIQPGNDRSLRLARKLGLRREGYSPDFINIQGAWKDHERWAITSDMITS